VEDDADGNGKYEVAARGFEASGMEWFATQTVNSNSSGQQVGPVAAVSATGSWVVTWQDDQDENRSWEVLARGLID
jgi:hypothetical protein